MAKSGGEDDGYESSDMGSEELDDLVASLVKSDGAAVGGISPGGDSESESEEDEEEEEEEDSLGDNGDDDNGSDDDEDDVDDARAAAKAIRRVSLGSVDSDDSRLLAALLVKTKKKQAEELEPKVDVNPDIVGTKRVLGSPRMFDSESSDESDDEFAATTSAVAAKSYVARSGEEMKATQRNSKDVPPQQRAKPTSKYTVGKILTLDASPLAGSSGAKAPAASPLTANRGPISPTQAYLSARASGFERAPSGGKNVRDGATKKMDVHSTENKEEMEEEKEDPDEIHGVSILSAVNKKLSHHGYDEVSTKDVVSLLETFLDVLYELETRGVALQNSMLAGSHGDGRGPSSTASVDENLESLKRKLAAAESRAASAIEDLEVAKKKSAEDRQHFQSSCGKMSAQLKQSETRARSKELDNEKLREKLRSELGRERERIQRNQKQKVVDVSLLNQAREEADDLRAELSRLAELLRNRENYILRMEGNANVTSGSLARYEVERHSRIAELQATVEERDRTIVALRKMQGQLHRSIAAKESALEEAYAEREERNEAVEKLKHELQMRPSTRAWREQQFRVEELERALATAVTKAKEAYNVRQLRKHTDTRELMRRDRESARLGLDVIDALPLDALKEAAKEACRELGVSDISQIGPGIEKLTKVVMVVPRLGSFAESICECLFEDAGDEAGVELPPPEDRTLESAALVVQGLVELRGELLRELARRPAKTSRKSESDAGLCAQVKQLVDAERAQAL